MKRCLLFFITMFCSLCALHAQPLAPSAAATSKRTYNISFWGSAGWLWYSDDATVPVRATGATVLFTHNDVSFGYNAGYAVLTSDFSKAQGTASTGFFAATASTSRLSAQCGIICAAMPHDVHIADSKPRFVLTDTQANFGWGGLSYRITDVVELRTSGFVGSLGMESGDLYYFYGKLGIPRLMGGSVYTTLPLGFGVYAGAITGSLNVKTNQGVVFGDGGLWLYLASAQKTFALHDVHGFALVAGYAYAAFDAQLEATPETQTYALFPYKQVAATADGGYHLAFAGGSYEYHAGHSRLRSALGYAVCFADYSSASYSYHYKKNLFFDGSAGSDDFEMPSFSRSALLCGFVDYAHSLTFFHHAKTTLSVRKLFVVPLLSPRTKSYFSTSTSTDGNNSSSARIDWNSVRTILLSGLTVALRVDFH